MSSLQTLVCTLEKFQKVAMGLRFLADRKQNKKTKFLLKAPSKKLTALTTKSAVQVAVKHNYEYRRVMKVDGLLCMVFMTYVNYQIVAHLSLAREGSGQTFKVEYLPMESELQIDNVDNFSEADFEIEVKRMHFKILGGKLTLKVDSKEEFLEKKSANKKVQNFIVDLQGRHRNIGMHEL